ncbi:MAG: hypothetical protein K2L74_09775 [Muribaculaceae bacterium]|nr:hypothetical protein [Muribaculaceae bacterium]
MKTLKPLAYRRVLAHRVVHGEAIFRMAIVDATGPDIVIEPFKAETAATPFVSGTVFVLSGKCFPDIQPASCASDAMLAHTPDIVDTLPALR